MQPKERKKVEKLTRIYIGVMFLIVGILFSKLAWMQILENEVYQLRADSNRNRLMTITATRGDIITSDGTVLVTDRPSYQVVIDNQKVRNNTTVITTLSEILNDPIYTPEYIQQICDDNAGRLYQPIVLKKGIDIATVSVLEARRSELDGVTIEEKAERTYLEGDLASHVLGYIGEVSQSELDAQNEGLVDTTYKMGDYVGKIGVEKYYDEVLRGQDGYKQIEVDANNRPLSDIKTVDPEAGENLVLTIDYHLQKTLEEAFDRQITNLQSVRRSDKAGAGAAIILNPNTGEVLAMVSRPADKVTQQNRAIQGRYIPGSTFKPATAVAALEAGVVTPMESIYSPGRYWKPPYIKSTAPAGSYNLYKAIAKSDNVYFQEVGSRAGIDMISRYGAELGLEGSTGIDLAYESQAERVTEGLPTQEKRAAYFAYSEAYWTDYYDKKIAATEEEYAAQLALAATEEERKSIEKKRKNAIAKLEAQKVIDVKWNTEWHAADTFNIAIGQGRQNYTPIQLAVYIATIANGGTVYEPYIVKQIEDANGNVVEKHLPTVKHEAEISPATLAEVRKGMEAVTSPGGGAYSQFAHFPKDLKVAAKTGTAQPGGSGYRTATQQYYDGLFVAFAPADNPEIVFVSVVEYGYSGAGSGGPICRAVFEEYFGLNR